MVAPASGTDEGDNPGDPEDPPPPQCPQRLEQRCETVSKVLASEVCQFQELLDAFAADQRKHMDMHRKLLERLLSSLPNRLQTALDAVEQVVVPQPSKVAHMHPPNVDEVEEAPETIPTGAMHLSYPLWAESVAPAPSYPSSAIDPAQQGVSKSSLSSTPNDTGTRAVSKSSVSSSPGRGIAENKSYKSSISSAITPAPPQPLQLTVQQEYYQMKSQGSKGTRTLSCVFTGFNAPARPRHRLPCSCVRRFVESHTFRGISFTVIVLNVVFSVVVSDLEVKKFILAMQGGQTEKHEWVWIADWLFLALFTAELLLRLVAEEVLFFVGENWKWNLFDFLVVAMTAVDSLSMMHGPDLSVARLGRILRVVRSIKMMRVVHLVHELRIMQLQILNSVKPMVWAFTFLSLVILTFTLVFMQGVISYFDDLQAGHIQERPESADLVEYCGSFIMSVLSLFMSISGGINWWSIVKPLMRESKVFTMLFLLYILVLMMGVLNIIVGIFVESATHAATRDRESLAQEELEKNVTLMRGLEQLFEEMDEDKEGAISLQRLEALAKDNEVRARFATLDLDVSQPHELFKMMDADGNGTVAIDEFVVGIMRMKGLAKRTDIHTLLCETSRMIRNLRRHRHWAEHRFNRIETCLAGFSKEVHGLSDTNEKVELDCQKQAVGSTILEL